MLLFLMASGAFQPRFPGKVRGSDSGRDYTLERLSASLFVCGWCALRLLAARPANGRIDALLAVAGLAFGSLSAAQCLRFRREQARPRARADDLTEAPGRS